MIAKEIEYLKGKNEYPKFFRYTDRLYVYSGEKIICFKVNGPDMCVECLTERYGKFRETQLSWTFFNSIINDVSEINEAEVALMI